VASDQLPLPFQHQPAYGADFLAAPSNEEALAWLDRTADWPDHRLALWGEPGCGKTHLLQLWAERSGATLLTGPTLHGLPGLSASTAVAIDDAAAIADETALLHLLNAAREHALPVLLAAQTPPARWSVHLADLASRLRALTSVRILPPDDPLLRALLLHLLSDRQLVMKSDLQDWLLRLLPRSPAALREAVRRLEQAALDRAARAKGGTLTKTIVSAALEGMADL
jgi:chromosomal replication initiation ATPase DnaA